MLVSSWAGLGVRAAGRAEAATLMAVPGDQPTIQKIIDASTLDVQVHR